MYSIVGLFPSTTAHDRLAASPVGSYHPLKDPAYRASSVVGAPIPPMPADPLAPQPDPDPEPNPAAPPAQPRSTSGEDGLLTADSSLCPAPSQHVGTSSGPHGHTAQRSLPHCPSSSQNGQVRHRSARKSLKYVVLVSLLSTGRKWRSLAPTTVSTSQQQSSIWPCNGFDCENGQNQLWRHVAGVTGASGTLCSPGTLVTTMLYSTPHLL